MLSNEGQDFDIIVSNMQKYLNLHRTEDTLIDLFKNITFLIPLRVVLPETLQNTKKKKKKKKSNKLKKII